MQYPSVARLGYWFAAHQKIIRSIQWVIILIYASLIIIPAMLPLPNDSATLFHNLTLLAGFIFWGVWWPFVLISIVLFGRLWCGVLCPEGALSEIANRYGRQKSIPKWIRWNGWPFVAFGITTLYGQMTSIYQYPKPVLLILGGSTVAAIIIGFLYGSSSRVWCKYLCPVTGVFNLLARLAPWRYQPMNVNANRYEANSLNRVRCPTLLPLPKMTGAANCLMCGKCGIAKDKMQLSLRSPHEEIVILGEKRNSFFDSMLIIFGLCGLALAAFQWSTSFWFQHFRDVIDSWALVHSLTVAFNTNVPWWVLTHYPERGDVFSWLYGLEVVSYIFLMGLIIGLMLTSVIAVATRLTGQLTLSRFNHLTQSFIPLSGCNVFIGLLANTTNLLQKYANLGFIWVNDVKYILLGLASLWSAILAFKIIKRYTSSMTRRIMSLLSMSIGFAVIDYSWLLMLHIWSLKADSVPWNTLWIF